MAGSLHSFDVLPDQKVKVITSPCIVCGKYNTYTLPLDKFLAWQEGAFIQDVFPDLSDGDRETLVTGTCSPCFDKIFPAES